MDTTIIVGLIGIGAALFSISLSVMRTIYLKRIASGTPMLGTIKIPKAPRERRSLIPKVRFEKNVSQQTIQQPVQPQPEQRDIQQEIGAVPPVQQDQQYQPPIQQQAPVQQPTQQEPQAPMTDEEAYNLQLRLARQQEELERQNGLNQPH